MVVRQGAPFRLIRQCYIRDSIILTDVKTRQAVLVSNAQLNIFGKLIEA